MHHVQCSTLFQVHWGKHWWCINCFLHDCVIGYDISEADNEKSPAEAGVDCSKVTPANSVCHARKLVAKGLFIMTKYAVLHRILWGAG